MKKDYREETVFMAANILDHYIFKIGVENFPKKKMVNLATTCMLMAAKLEQPVSPSFYKMINYLTENEKKYVSKSSLIDLEAKILVVLGFDFNFPSPIHPLDRYLRVLNYNLNQIVFEMSF